MENAILEGEMWMDERGPDRPHGHEHEHGYGLRLAESTVAGTPPTPSGHESTRAGAVDWLLYRLQELGIPAPASTPAT
jgi:hypothetical protein